ncbi:unnamed protein product [Closterium sp. Yama58-4]|nr:unnamed protein product [Closterium sp. Yama58-4]
MRGKPRLFRHKRFPSLDNRVPESDWAELAPMAGSEDHHHIGMPHSQQQRPLLSSSDATPKSMPTYLRRSLGALFFGARSNVLLVCVPATFLAILHNFPDGYVFTLSLLSLIPLAERLGFVTEQLALCTNPTLGGLLNATFSNAPELIIVLVALKRGLVRIIQLSILGSILGNLLLCMGSAFLAGGIYHKHLEFNRPAAQMNSGALMLAMSGMLFPNLLHATGTELHEYDSQLGLSRFAAVLMLFAYGAYIYFQLVTHREFFEEGGDDGGDGGADGGGGAEQSELGLWGGVFWLFVVTTLISVLSDDLVNSVEGTAAEWNVPLSGICVVVLPLVNNVTEHTSAIFFGMRDKLDVALSIAVGSSIQLAMFLIPLAVIGGWIIGVPMDLNFHRFETLALFITVLVTVLVLHEANANWLKGLMLVLMYAILAATFFNHKETFLGPDSGHVGSAVGGVVGGAAGIPALHHDL